MNIRHIYRKLLIWHYGTHRERYKYRCWVCQKRVAPKWYDGHAGCFIWTCGHKVFFWDKADKE